LPVLSIFPIAPDKGELDFDEIKPVNDYYNEILILNRLEKLARVHEFFSGASNIDFQLSVHCYTKILICLKDE